MKRSDLFIKILGWYIIHYFDYVSSKVMYKHIDHHLQQFGV